VSFSCEYVIVLPGRSSPRPPFSRFARRAVTGKLELDHCSVLEILTGWTGPNDLLLYVIAWYNLPVTARRAKRENGGLGEDPPGRTMTQLTGPSDLGGSTLGVGIVLSDSAVGYKYVSLPAPLRWCFWLFSLSHSTFAMIRTSLHEKRYRRTTTNHSCSSLNAPHFFFRVLASLRWREGGWREPVGVPPGNEAETNVSKNQGKVTALDSPPPPLGIS
jgi:hypothetical protein